MGCCTSAPDTKNVPLYYCDNQGNLVIYQPTDHHSRKDELSYINTEEAKPFRGGEECYLIYAPWLDYWSEYCSESTVAVRRKSKSQVKTTGVPRPKHINNYELIEQTTGLLKSTAVLKTDFRPISKKVWEYLFHLYGGGPAIYFNVPSGLEEKAYKKGSWAKHVVFRDCIKIIYPTDTKPKLLIASKPSESEINPLVSMSLYAMQQDVGASKIRQGLALQKDINEAVAESVGAAFAKDLGKQKFVQAEKMNVEISEQKTAAVAAVFVDDMAESKKRQAAEQHRLELQAQEQRVMESLKGAGAKQRFRTYLSLGKMKEAENEAAKMLQGVWRAKIARKVVEKRRREKQRLLEERAAIKLQGRWRIKQSKARVKLLREQQQHLREQGAAIMLQASWRMRKAKQKVARLRAEKQRLLEEGSAMMLQSAWRRKRACKQVAVLRSTRDKERAARKKLAHFALRYVAKLRFLRRKRQAVHVLAITLKSAADLRVADTTGASDPYVTIQGWHADPSTTTINPASPTHKASAISSRHIFNGASKVVSSYKSQVINRNLNPTWNETFLLPGINGYDDLVLTVADHDTLTQHDFLGQVIVHLADYDKIFAGKTVNITLPLQRYQLPLKDEHDKDMSLGETEAKATAPKGSLTISIHLPSAAYIHAGNMLRQSKGMGFGIGLEFKPRYFILSRERLAYYVDAHSLEHQPKGMIPCDAITSIELVTAKGGATHYLITCGKEHWEIRFMVEGTMTADALREIWFRKLHNCCRNAVISNPSSSSSPSSSSTPSPLSKGSPSAASTSSATKNPPKRSSMFGR